MNINDKISYCQSCGMPLNIISSNNEECNMEPGTNYSSEEFQEIMSSRLPGIKRWKQKFNTAHIQYDLIIKIQEYINRHLFDRLDSEQLSQTACVSKYHFRRLFKVIAGESVGSYIRRLRLEHIAFKLISTDISVSKLISQTHYQNKHTLSRAFKSYFNCSIPEFRKQHSSITLENKNPIQIIPNIEYITGMRIAYLKLDKRNKMSQKFSVLWKQLIHFSETYRLTSKGHQYVSLSLDHPQITPEEQSRILIGITLPPTFEQPKGFGIYEVPSGNFAIFRFKGFYHELNSVYRYIYLDWLPSSLYYLREQFTFETYVKTPEKTPVSELITDIYVPVMKRVIAD